MNKQIKPVFIQNQDYKFGLVKGTVKATEERLALKVLLTEAGVDPNIWYVEDFKIRKSSWGVTMKLDQRKKIEGKYQKIGDKVHSATNKGFYIEARLKRLLPVIDVDNFRKFLKEDVFKDIKLPKQKDYNYPKKQTGNLFMPGIVDPHIGKLAWALESGQNYDVKLAIKYHNNATNYLLNLAKPFKPTATLLVVGNDTYNYDYSSPYPMTTAGTPQEADVRWQKMFRIGVQMWIRYIEWCKQFGPVNVLTIAGNHDYHLSWLLGEVLVERYLNDAQVKVNNDPKSRKYFKWGKNMIGFAHGRWEKPAMSHMFMSVDNKRMWANTAYRYYFLGDVHHEEVHQTNPKPIPLAEDYRGVLTEILPTLAQVDKYEATRGFVGTIKGTRAMIFNDKIGRIAKLGFNL